MKERGYPGNKQAFGSYQNIINQFPVHQNFISACLGSGQVEKRKKLAENQNVGCELESKVIAKYWKDSKGYTVLNTDFLKWYPKEQKKYRGTTLIYADPPYVLSSRRSGKEYYENEWTDEMHEQFLQLALRSPHLFAISHYRNKMYDHYLKDWRVIKWPVMTHGGPAMEALYMNYSMPAELHQYDFIGKDFIDRQRLKRMKDNFIEYKVTIEALEEYSTRHSLTYIMPRIENMKKTLKGRLTRLPVLERSFVQDALGKSW